MSTAQRPQVLEEREEKRIQQIEVDLLALHSRVSEVEELLHFIVARLKKVELYTPETLLTDSIVPS